MKGSITMKKTISIFLILSVLTVCIIGAALAEEFSVRNGVKFGLSANDVFAIEKENGITKTPSKYDDTDYTSYSYSDVSIAGKLGYLNYEFSKDDKLLGIRYLYEEYSNTKIADTYIEMEQLLKEKYGEPLNTDSSGVLFPSYTSALRYGKIRKLLNYEEWLVEYDDYAVIIDIVFCNNKKAYTCAIGYKCITKEEMNLIVQAFEEKENEAQRDL